MSSNQEFIGEFIAESLEHLDTSEACLLRLTRDAGEHDAVQACFRALHTIKGGAGFMDLDRIQSLAHSSEQLLDAVREQRTKADQAVCDILLTAISRLREMVEALANDSAPPGDEADLKQCLRSLLPKDETSSYTPSADPVVAQAATSRRIARPVVTPIDQLTGELVALDPADPGAIAACLKRFIATAQAQAWPANAMDLIAQMRGTVGQLSDTALRAAAHAKLMALAEQLIATVLALPGVPAAAVVPVTDPHISAAAAAATTKATTNNAPLVAVQGDLPSLADFAAEAEDLLARAEAVLLQAAAPDHAHVEELFRSFHTVKGMAGYLGHPRIEQLAHAIESRLLAARDGTEAFSPTHHALALSGIDALRVLLSDLLRSGADRGPWPAAVADCANQLGLAFAQIQPVAADEQGLPAEIPRLEEILAQPGQISRATIAEVTKRLKPGEQLAEKLVESGKIARDTVDQAVAKQQELAAKAQADSFARVSIARLEELVNQVGELLIAQAQVSHDEDVVRSPRLATLVGRQARVVRSLQSLALGLRLVPLRATFQKMTRVVHDTARKVDKQIELEITGEDVEIDRTLVEAIADPLLHMVRNAVDHGVETGAARTAVGKKPAGRIQLSASQASDHIMVRLQDDGKGLDAARLTAKAKEKGLIPADAVLSESEAWNLIFLPGFSTAEQVTGISGRGVGMDVVRRNLERVKGRVEIHSVLGQGTVFTIRLPLTTAILDAMTMRVGDQTFLVPTTAVVEALRPIEGQVKEVLGTGRVIATRGQLVPVVALSGMFAIAEAEGDPTRAVIVVLERDGGPLALQVDELLGLQQVVIKPLDAERHHPGVSGAAILGDGRVGLILDPTQLLAS